MHIAYLTPEYPHPRLSNSGGLGTSVKNLVNELVKQGHTITLFIYGQKESDTFAEDGVYYHLIKKEFYKVGGFYFYRKTIESYIRSHSNSVDLIEAPDWTGITAFMRFRQPLIIRIHGSDAYFCKLDKRKQKFKNFFFEKRAFAKADGYIAPSQFAGEQTVKIFGLDKKKLKIIPHGIQLDDFKNPSPSVYAEKTILYLGTLIRKKGVLELAKIFNKLITREPNAKFILIGADSSDIQTGSSSTYELMQELFSTEAKPQVKYLGKVPYEDVQKHICNAHVCVYPSFAETFGMVTVESMALQKAVVNTNIGWAKDLIDPGENGFLIHPESTDEYCETILTLFNDNSLCTRIASNSRYKVIQDFDISKRAFDNSNYYKTFL